MPETPLPESRPHARSRVDRGDTRYYRSANLAFQGQLREGMTVLSGGFGL